MEEESMAYFEKMGYLDRKPSSLDTIKEEKENRMNKRIEAVKKECSIYGFKNWVENNRIYIETPNGKWYFNAKEEQVHLFHKNYRFRQSTMGNYHRQFVRDISMHELLRYISNHDKEAYTKK